MLPSSDPDVPPLWKFTASRMDMWYPVSGKLFRCFLMYGKPAWWDTCLFTNYNEAYAGEYYRSRMGVSQLIGLCITCWNSATFLEKREVEWLLPLSTCWDLHFFTMVTRTHDKNLESGLAKGPYQKNTPPACDTWIANLGFYQLGYPGSSLTWLHECIEVDFEVHVIYIIHWFTFEVENGRSVKI